VRGVLLRDCRIIVVVNNFQIYLASKSPRRRQLLEQIGVRFELVDADVDESAFPIEAPQEFVLTLARAKVMAANEHLTSENLPLKPVLGADTCVVIDDEILGKPNNKGEAIRMLTRLSGTTHSVYTGVALYHDGKMNTQISHSSVTFAVLQSEQIEQYWASSEPTDKAGAYAIQGRAATFITQMNGSYSGVVGLPLYETTQLLAAAGVEI